MKIYKGRPPSWRPESKKTGRILHRKDDSSTLYLAQLAYCLHRGLAFYYILVVLSKIERDFLQNKRKFSDVNSRFIKSGINKKL
ncbi:MAG: hypothetical protein M3247_07100 [Thermoproteota archaeon]|nr:hypothetical protein [Thermoproteota archaeon]